MAKKDQHNSSNRSTANHASSRVEELLLAALERNDSSYETGRYLATFRDGAGDLTKNGFKVDQGMNAETTW